MRRSRRYRTEYAALERALSSEIVISRPNGERLEEDQALAVNMEALLAEPRRCFARHVFCGMTELQHVLDKVFDIEAAHAELEKMKAEYGDASIDPIGDAIGFRRFLVAAVSTRSAAPIRLVTDGVNP